MRTLLAAVAVVLFPVFANAQQTNPVPLADYVSLCLAIWTDSPDTQAKANALGLQSGIAAGARVTIGKSTIQFYKSGQGSQTIVAVTTAFADGEESSCDINPGIGLERADLETLERALHLDGQILTLGPATIGYWKLPEGRPPVLLKAVISSRAVTLNLQKFEPAAKDVTHRH
jgi:hypothetical protein